MPYSPGTVGSLRSEIAAALSELDSPLLEADLLIAYCAGKDRAWVHTHMPDPAPEGLVDAARRACGRRREREPLQYITGGCDFDGLEMTVLPGCLVPRPETELLVQCAAEHFGGGTFIDWGTGTGCIAVALLKRFPTSRAVMVDASPDALACARANLEKFDLTGRAQLVMSRTPDDIRVPCVSMIVSNPPYVPTGDVDGLMPEISRWEPRLALDGGSDGLDPYRELFPFAERALLPGGVLCVEYGGGAQTPVLRRLARKDFRQVALLRDIAGHDRVIAWQFSPC